MSHLNREASRRRPRPGAALSSAASLYILFALAGCARGPVESPLPPPTADVLVEPGELTLQAGEEAWLAAQANDAAGQPIGGVAFGFRPADPDVLQVSPQGLVTALGPAGVQTHVVVSSAGHERRVPVTVTPGPPQRLEKLEGDGQQVIAGQAPPVAIAARLMDGWGNPLAGIPVSVRTAADTFPPDEIVTSADGTARFAVPSLPEPGTVVVTLRAGKDDGPFASFELRVQPLPSETEDEAALSEPSPAPSSTDAAPG